MRLSRLHNYHHHSTLEVGTYATTVLQTSRAAIEFPRSDLSIPESLAIMSGKVNLGHLASTVRRIGQLHP